MIKPCKAFSCVVGGPEFKFGSSLPLHSAHTTGAGEYASVVPWLDHNKLVAITISMCNLSLSMGNGKPIALETFIE